MTQKKQAFSAGFVTGFASPFRFFIKTPIKNQNASVGRAVHDVGAAFFEVMRSEGAFPSGEARNTKRTRGSREHGERNP
ncbi:hypothetical protein ACI2J4_00365 [Agrobacterium tumefaciens]|uniref:hypothetical protein n=1 Tax=Agrobacterium tumefaciens TaxID=358 RepID=UPI00384A88DE